MLFNTFIKYQLYGSIILSEEETRKKLPSARPVVNI